MSSSSLRKVAWSSLCWILVAAPGCGPDASLDLRDRPRGEGKGTPEESELSAPSMPLTGAFDGSGPFRMWVDTMRFAREIRAMGKPLAFTYFINSAYYTTADLSAPIGRAHSQREVVLRWALTQQAVNEGHEVADHTYLHRDGGSWTVAQWEAELRWQRDKISRNLFQPIRDASGEPVFPKWEPAPRAPVRGVGSACNLDSDCDSGQCLAVSESRAFCSRPCAGPTACPHGTVCGGPALSGAQADVCLPLPKLPVYYRDELLFDAQGQPNLAHRALRPYSVVGFRAPYLAANKALFEALTHLGYRYDTSQVLPPGPPARTRSGGQVFAGLWQLPLMRNAGSSAIPMDYNYFAANLGADVMLADYRRSIVDAYVSRGKQPYNIGHHFTLYLDGAYWKAMQEAFVFAAQGCPDWQGKARCPDVSFPSFRELTERLDASGVASVSQPLQQALAAEGAEIEAQLLHSDGCH